MPSRLLISGDKALKEMCFKAVETIARRLSIVYILNFHSLRNQIYKEKLISCSKHQNYRNVKQQLLMVFAIFKSSLLIR